MDDYQHNLRKLATFLRTARLGGIAIAVYDTLPVRERTVARLREMLEGFAWQEIRLSADEPSVQAAVRSGAALSYPATVLVYGLDDLADENRRRMILHLNLGREFFVRFVPPIVLWVKPLTAQELAQHAPDFWHWRSGTFEFSSQPESVERRLRIYENLLSQYQTLGIDNPVALEEINRQLVRLKSAGAAG